VLPAAAQNWITLFDGSSLDNWNGVGNAKFKIVDGAVEAEGNGTLVTKNSYKDFEITGEFWVDEPANSGIFLRASDPQRVGANTSYEVNIYDSRPDPTYATGSIMNVASPKTAVKTANKWNTFVIRAQGQRLIVEMNGIQTVDVQDSQHGEGYIGLQFGTGVIKFRNIRIRTL
jgi:hypothetical protein